MKREEIEELRKLEAAATPAPWERLDDNDPYVVERREEGGNVAKCFSYQNGEANADATAAARNALPRLLAEREALVGALRALMLAVADDCIECAKAREALALAES